ncbi:AMP-binding protein [Iamia majanohamensis]|uniref:AMP-binding protein n=1 Tax=Iamia majanohamensis TaxID=467976 RepID=A0AAF0BRI9_9ACTN|nr:AMP-binding protein [Iamia majanohamensis]WCO66756.1 AMP-binding protein [Iamia majanohamensis]
MNLASILDPHPDDAPALISRGRTTSYGTLREQAGRLAGGLAGLGVGPGDRVGLVCSNNWYFVVSYFAVLRAGAVAVPLNPLTPPRGLQGQLAEVGARAVVVGPSGQAALAGADRAALPDLEHVVTTGADAEEGLVALDDAMAAEPLAMVERDDDDAAVLMFTSGTAGAPRAAILSHGNLRANIDQVLAVPESRREDDVSLCVLPLFHIMGLNAILGTALRAGSTVLLMERFDPQSAAEAIGKHGVTVIAGAPAMWAAWAALPGLPPGTFGDVRVSTSGAAALAPDVVDRMRERFGLTLTEGYGLTEASPVVTSSLGLDHRPGSIGAPLDGVEVRLVDAEGDDVLVGDEGEILVRGDNVFQGYWGDTDGECPVLTEDGWLRTGDVGVVDDEGYLFLVDRAKDLIIVSGFNVFPAEVEEVVLEHPAVAECAVVGVAHPYSGEAVKAFVVVDDGRSVEEDEVIDFCAARLPRYKCPEKVLFVDELPHGLAGKVLKRELRAS